MPRQLTHTVYTFDELSDEAKAKAREWYREAWDGDTFWSDVVLEDVELIAPLLGITFDKTRENRPPVGRSKIYWSGFWSQGDGASFEGTYEYVADASAKIRDHAPQDETLHGIADALTAIQATSNGTLRANIRQSDNHYCHSHTMQIEVENVSDEDDATVTDEQEQVITNTLRAFADWIYRQLESEYEYQMSDETVSETIRANEYEFTADGNRSVVI